MFTCAVRSVWVVWPSEQQMGQTELVESRLDFFFFPPPQRDTSSLPNMSPSSEMKGPDNAAIFSSLMSSQASGMVSLFPERERVSSSAHHTTKTNQMKKHLQST